MNDLLVLEGVSYRPETLDFFKAEKSNLYILKNISFILGEGEILGVTGESGSGKTTLAKIIAGLIKPTTGTFTITPTFHTKEKRSNVQILFQNNEELINPLRIIKNILRDTTVSEEAMADVCNLTGIQKNLLEKKAYQLSGGERQRVALASLLSVKPDLLILDEPFSAQDPESQDNFIELFRKINSELNLTMICISHDISILKLLSHQTVILYDGEIVESGPTADIYNAPAHPYTKFLFKSNKYSLKREDFTNGESSANAACSFYNRCTNKKEKCLTEVEKSISGKHITKCNYPF